uniref:Uncharacterized protein n=1 Tax=Arundo donax TaxID=35708 RepID=A0A0A9GWR9_ARUDO
MQFSLTPWLGYQLAAQKC